MVRFNNNPNVAYQQGQNVQYLEISCRSTDTKPTAGVATGSICVEVDTGKVFLYDETSGWVEQFSLQE